MLLSMVFILSTLGLRRLHCEIWRIPNVKCGCPWWDVSISIHTSIWPIQDIGTYPQHLPVLTRTNISTRAFIFQCLEMYLFTNIALQKAAIGKWTLLISYNHINPRYSHSPALHYPILFWSSPHSKVISQLSPSTQALWSALKTLLWGLVLKMFKKSEPHLLWEVKGVAIAVFMIHNESTFKLLELIICVWTLCMATATLTS
jgi:hypothetical protein